MGAIIFGENFMVRGQFSWGEVIFLGGNYTQGQFSLGAIVRGAVLLGAIVSGAIIRGAIFLRGNCPRTVCNISCMIFQVA